MGGNHNSYSSYHLPSPKIWSNLLLVILLGIISISCSEKYYGYKLISFKVNEDVARWLSDFDEENSYIVDKNTGNRRLIFDIFGEPSRYKDTAEVLVAPEFYQMFLEALREQGIYDVRIIKKDIGNEIRKERKDLQKAIKSRARRALRDAMDFDDKSYHSYQEMVDFMVRLSEQKPDLVELLNITNSFEGRRIYGVRIRKQAPIKPSILVDAGVHAREWIAPAVALHMIKKLVGEYGKDPQITTSINKFDWYIIPQVNPDGYEYSRTRDRLWRKTRSLNSTVNKWCTGADANRNWGYRWGEAGANRSPCSNIYAGSRPYSEPEVAGLKEFITYNIPSLQIYISLHSYGQLFLSPWGYTMQKPQNYWDQRNAARAAVMAIKNMTGAKYTFGSISEVMYPASGTSIDYMQHRGVPYIYGVELRPLDTVDGYAFSLPPRYIEPTGDEMLAAVLAIGEYAIVHKRL